MPRQPRISFEDALYHITSRGNSKRAIFLDASDNEKFLSLLGAVVETSVWICHGFCLMNNHYHLIVETPHANVSEGMHELNGEYARFFNWKYNNVGHLFQSRFHSALVTQEAHFLELIRYIVLNPVRAGLVGDVCWWPWSSYGMVAQGEDGRGFITTEFTLSQFSDSQGGPVRGYCDFVARGLTLDPLCAFDTTGLLDEEEAKEVQLPLEMIYEDCGHVRDAFIYKAHMGHGHMAKRIADFLGISTARVTQIIGKMRKDSASI
jgi:REP element-mobilizing transposase RayT